ncbi:MAG: RnfH family protein [Moraxella sp.]|nr:RnfH family protein [Moraxella sp.]
MTEILVSLVYVHDDGALYQMSLSLPDGSTALDAITASSWLDLPDFQAFKTWLSAKEPTEKPTHKAWYLGIFSQKIPLDHPLKTGDRLEIYRPLALDPMKKRQGTVAAAAKAKARLRSAQPARQRGKKRNAQNKASDLDSPTFTQTKPKSVIKSHNA